MGFLDLFSRPSHKSKDPQDRLKAVASLEDQAILANLARTDSSPRVRLAATSRIIDQELLTSIALDGDHLDSRVAAVERIESQETLARIIKVRRNFKLMGACFARITDKKILEAIANDQEYNISARRMAIDGYADESLLTAMATRPAPGGTPKTPEEIRAFMQKYGAERLARAVGRFRGSKSAILALGEIMRHGGEAASVALEPLAQALAHANPEVSRAAEDELAEVKDPALIAQLIGMMDKSGLHDGILAVLRRIDHPDARDIVESAD